MGEGEELFAGLRGICASRTVLLGIGNTLKGDDGAGPFVCEKVQGAVSATVIDAGTVPENYIQKIVSLAPRHLLIIDAADFGAAAGDMRVFGAEELANVSISTHSLSPRLFLDVIGGSIDVEAFLIAIQPKRMGFGQGLSGEVERAATELAGKLRELLG
jgi:hydrogenase 3 maturation protease